MIAATITRDGWHKLDARKDLSQPSQFWRGSVARSPTEVVRPVAMNEDEGAGRKQRTARRVEAGSERARRLSRS